MTSALCRAGGRVDRWDADPVSPLRLSWPAGAEGSLLVVEDAATGSIVHQAVPRAGEQSYALPAGTLLPSRRYRWRMAGGSAGGAFGTGPGTMWASSTSIWAPDGLVAWRDYDVEVTVRRSAIRQDGDRPALGAGMDVPGARRFRVLGRAQDDRNAHAWTIDPEAGVLVASLLRDGAESELARVEWVPADERESRFRVRLSGETAQVFIGADLALTHGELAWAAGAAGLGCPADARAQIARFRVTASDGSPLAGEGTQHPWPMSGECDADGVLHLAERSTGLVPSWGEWAFLRHEFTLPAGRTLAWATVFLAATSAEPARQFVARVSVNGVELGTGPVRAVAGEHRYDGFDATALLAPGANAIGIVAWTPEERSVQAEIALGLADGEVTTVGTSSRWRALAGEHAYRPLGSVGTGYYAAPREWLSGKDYPGGFDTAGFDDAAWAPAVERAPLAPLVPNPGAKVSVEEYPPGSSRRLDDGLVVIDFGVAYVGGLSLPRVGEGCELTLRFGEMLDEHGRVRSRMATGNHYEDRWWLTGDEPATATWGLRVFRYVEIEGLPEEFDPQQVRARGHVYPLGQVTRFRTDDAVLERILDLCAHTMVQSNGNLLVDSWSREREPYEADAYLQARANAALSADEALASYSLDYLLERRTWPTEWPFYLVLYGWEHYMRFGDLEALARRRDALAALLPLEWIDPGSGLVRKLHGSDGSGSRVDHDIVDWPASERDGFRFGAVNTVVNAIFHGALRALARIDTALGLPTAEMHARLAADLADGMNLRLWDEALGTYADGMDENGERLPHAGSHAGAFAVAFDVASDERARRVAAFLAPRGMRTSVYAAPFLIEALLRGGRSEEAYALITGDGERSWNAMIRAGAGATMEAWSEALKPNVSCAHPWAASPLFLVVEDFLGIRPLEPGFRSFSVDPRVPSRLSSLGATVPTVAGDISVDVERDGEDRRLRVVVPPGASCRVSLPGGGRTLTDGEHTFTW